MDMFVSYCESLKAQALVDWDDSSLVLESIELDKEFTAPSSHVVSMRRKLISGAVAGPKQVG